MTTEQPQMLRFIASNQVTLEVSLEAMRISNFIKNMVDDMGVPPSVLPLTSVSEKILKLVIEYVNYHYKNWRDPDTKGPGLTDWELNLYKDLSNADLREFLQAANFLDIPDLVDSLARFFATKLVGKSYAEIKEMFEGSDDLDQ